jgi:hypothetical protein
MGSSVRNDGLRHTMQTPNTSNIQFGVPLSPVVGVHQNEMRRLGEPINDHPYGIKLAGRERQTHNETNADVFSFPCRNIQRLQQSGRSHIIDLDPSTRVAFCNVASSLALHPSPLELHFSDHDTYSSCRVGWNTWKYEPHQISSCATHGS